MSWQKIRKHLRDLWTPEVSKDLDVHIARYRNSGVWDNLGRATFIHKKEEIYTISDSQDWDRCEALFGMGRLYVNHDSSLSSLSDELGFYDVERFYKLTDFYLNSLNIKDAFDSNILLFQIYATLDRRVRKRTLLKNEELFNSNEILKKFHDIRTGAI